MEYSKNIDKIAISLYEKIDFNLYSVVRSMLVEMNKDEPEKVTENSVYQSMIDHLVGNCPCSFYLSSEEVRTLKNKMSLFLRDIPRF